MKLFLTTSTLFGILFTGLFSAALISKASAAAADSLQQSVLTENSIEDEQIIAHHDCYYDTYGNLHCW